MDIAYSMVEIIADCWEAVKVCVMGEGLLQGSIVSPTWEVFELEGGIGLGRQMSYF